MSIRTFASRRLSPAQRFEPSSDNGASRATRAFAGVGAVSALVASSMFLATSPANAMISETFAEPGPQTDSVVALTLGVKNSDRMDCTGTAISPRWVVTARHCVDGENEHVGRVHIGQGENRRSVEIAGWEVAPKGDVTLVHTAEDMGLGFYPKVGKVEDKTQEATVYGWSVDGSGKGEKLPVAKANFEDGETLALFEGGLTYNVRLKDGARIQPGDSGDPVFTNGEVVGVLSAGIDMANPEAETSPTGTFAGLEENAQWIAGTMKKDTANQGEAAVETSFLSSPILWGGIGGVVVIALFVAMAIRKKQGE